MCVWVYVSVHAGIDRQVLGRTLVERYERNAPRHAAQVRGEKGRTEVVLSTPTPPPPAVATERARGALCRDEVHGSSGSTTADPTRLGSVRFSSVGGGCECL